jgi:hypothetical protein
MSRPNHLNQSGYSKPPKTLKEDEMSTDKNQATEKAKPHGNTDTEVPNSPDVKHEGWSAEKIAEQAANKDGAEVKEEMKQGKKTQSEEDK